MDLFSQGPEISREAPLAARMRPRSLAEFYGQEHIVGEGRLLRRAIEADRLTSMIFYGPPGTGKTTLAEIIAKTTQSHFERLNAVTAGVADIRRVVDEARERLKFYRQKTLLFIDEIHRFSKSQQDALLPAVEEGIIVLIGATTENPFYEVNAPLVSRSMIFRLNPLTREELKAIIESALRDSERGLGYMRIELAEDALDFLLNVADGDARMTLNALELAAVTTKPDPATGIRYLTLAVMKDCIQQRPLVYDKQGQAHYDTISAFIKSMRGSDPDAAVYYLARMLTAGEDPKFIARRMMIHAAEDVGNADPRALLIATAAAQAVEMIGLPEAQIIMSQAAIYIATAPKSNACCAAIHQAMADVQDLENKMVPAHLRDSSHPGVHKLGDGVGYRYPHDDPEGYVPQDYLPENLLDKTYYHPTNRGYEREIQDYLEHIRKRKAKGE
ncbi:MAG TPA: replication-associated recombination protein A [Bacillota bacterium]|mgnify:FL=1|nr:replication-associated recombination protein A [Bacillota bacterium]HPT87132.1 replication-associated recombination protein A [Bacillota bacterium]